MLQKIVVMRGKDREKSRFSVKIFRVFTKNMFAIAHQKSDIAETEHDFSLTYR
jgi:hypothetical protein